MATVEKNQTNLIKCRCPGCPSYNDCAKEKAEKIFCAKAVKKSTCAFKIMGCLCPSCPVYRENNLKSAYYCLYGPAK